MRILGGEPLLNDEYVNYLFDFITKASEKDASKFKEGVIIQTNGIHIGRGNSYVLGKRLEELHSVNPDVLVVIETSIKGSNENEFQLISRSSESLYEYNIQSYYELLDLDLPNLRPVVIAGLGVNESFLLEKGISKHAISILYDEDTPVFHPSIWDVKFSELYDDFTARYEKLNPRFRRMPMYGIYGDKVYDATYADRNYTVEKKFYDILEKFFYPGNQQYYSTLTGR